MLIALMGAWDKSLWGRSPISLCELARLYMKRGLLGAMIPLARNPLTASKGLKWR